MYNPRPLEEFVALVTANENGNKKELRLSNESARRIADSITYLLLELSKYHDQVNNLKKDLGDSQSLNIELHGGKFNED